MQRIPQIMLLCLVLLCISCKPRIKDVTAYNAWLNEPDHGVIYTHRIGGVSLSVKYQPPAYLVLKELEQMGDVPDKSTVRDSLLRNQQQFMTFLMKIGPDESVPQAYRGAIMEEGVNSYADYVQRVLATNFSMEQYIGLYIGDSVYTPLLSIMENMYELTHDRSFVTVFPLPGKEQLDTGQELVFVYNDPFFNIGKVQFPFLVKQLADADGLHVVWK